MDYITVSEAAEKWGVTGRSIKYHLTAGRIYGAVKKGKLWLIPAGAERPADQRRRVQPSPHPSFSDELAAIIDATFLPMPNRNPDAVLDTVSEDRLHLQYEGELAYLRGDFRTTMACFQRTLGDNAARLRACPVAVAAAISLGNYPAYAEIEAYLKRCADRYKGGIATSLAEHALATAAVSVIAPSMAPDWLKRGDFSAFAPQMKPNALYLRAKYFLCVGRFDAMLGVAQTALTLSAQPQAFTSTDIYLRVTCAVACHYLGQDDEARRWLLEAMRIALPHGFLTPFAENITALGGLAEQCLEREFPACYDAVLGQWKHTWRNWMTFHNQFTKDNITLILSLREYHLALLVAQRVPYARIAKQHNISVGRLKNIMLEIYEKLYISGREELVKYIL